jgi:hypothetical protein
LVNYFSPTGAGGGGAGLVDEAEHDADIVPLECMEEVEEIAVGELRSAFHALQATKTRTWLRLRR